MDAPADLEDVAGSTTSANEMLIKSSALASISTETVVAIL